MITRLAALIFGIFMFLFGIWAGNPRFRSAFNKVIFSMYAAIRTMFDKNAEDDE
jgi:hypothetical protein